MENNTPRYQLRAWTDGGALTMEWHDGLDRAHERQHGLQREGYFSWVHDRQEQANVSVFLHQPQPVCPGCALKMR